MLEDIARRDANSVEILNKLLEISHSTSDTITITYTNTDNTKTVINLPSYQFMLSELRRISKNFDYLSNSDSLVVKNSSGNNILFTKTNTAEFLLNVLSVPSTFSAKLVADEMMFNPLVNMEVPVNSAAEKMLVKKIVLDLDNDEKLSYFNTNYADKIVQHTGVEEDLLSKAIEYQEFEFEAATKRKSLINYGNFDVVTSRADKISISINNTPIEKDVLYYKLNTLYYTGPNNSRIQLKVGDSIITNGNYGRYSVESVFTNTNEISLKLEEGFGLVAIGVGTISVQPKFEAANTLLIPVKPQEYCLYFIKSIDSVNNSVAGDWSSGFGIFTSNIKNTEGTNLYNYYNEWVKDINRTIAYVNNDGLIPFSDGVIPNIPQIATTDFNVVQINTHKDDSTFIDTVKKNLEQKDALKKEIELIDKEVVLLKNSLSGKSAINSTLIDKVEKDIDDKLVERKTKLDQYISIVEDLVTKNKAIIDYAPKYAIRGFIPIPEPVYQDAANNIGKQEVVQFIISYRYLSKNNTTNNTQTFTQQVGGKQVSAQYGPWVEEKTKAKVKVVGTDGLVTWQVESLSDADVINFNQISVAISKGENVEIRVKAVSEAGFPYSPIESAWSSSVIVNFPEIFERDVEVTIDSLLGEKAVIELKKELEAIGMTDHLSDSLTIQDRKYVHQAENIVTNITDETGKVYDVDTYLKVLKTNSETLFAILNKAKAKANIYITNANGELITKVNNFDTTKIFAGYYSEEVASLTVPKGEIVSKLYYITVQNDGEADMEILPYQPGIVNTRLAGIDYTTNNFYNDASYYGYMFNKSEYDSYRRYHRVPISLQSILNDNDLYAHYTTNKFPYINLPTFQSMQAKGQWIYARDMDVSLTEKLYDHPGVAGSALLPIDTINGVASTDQRAYVWDGTMGSSSGNGNGRISDFCVHVDHPDLLAGSEFFDEFATISYSTGKVPKTNVGGALNNVKYPPFIHSAFFNLEANKLNGTKQLEYVPYETLGTNPTIANFARKIGFTKNDKYLIGVNTVGSYLFMATPDYNSIYTGSAIYSQGVIIKKGDAIRIPVIFQYRMTDYNGDGSIGNGDIGGFGRATTPVNLTYTKKIGVDLVIKDFGIFSFDVEVTAKYKADSVGSLVTGG